MSTSQNGYTVYTSATGLQPFPWVTGRLRPGDVYAVFDYLCRRFDREVENIIVAHSWGYAYRAVRGQTSGFSNHASGTAIDLNAPAHPLGRRGTFSDAQEATIRRILGDLGGVIRWGGSYSGRPDEMHFEINASPAAVAAVAARLRNTDQEDDMADEKTQKTLAAIQRAAEAAHEDAQAARKAAEQGLKEQRAIRRADGRKFVETRKMLEAIASGLEVTPAMARTALVELDDEDPQAVTP